MIKVRKADNRGATKFDWLDSRHTFSFADYVDKAQMGYRSLRVINDDRIMGGGGFGMHPHKDMEIVTYIHEGELEHRDSMGNKRTLKAGDVQRMTAGTGVTHAEVNASKTDPVRLLQIWILPEKTGLAPTYEEKSFADVRGLRMVVSRDGRGGSLRIHQDINIFLGCPAEDGTASLACTPGKGYWVQMITGMVELNGTRLFAGDGAIVEKVPRLEFKAKEQSAFLVFELT